MVGQVLYWQASATRTHSLCWSGSGPRNLRHLRGRGSVKNEDQLIQQLLDQADGHFEAMSGGRVNSNELVATLISQRPTIARESADAQEMVEGTVSVLIMTPDCLIAGRDKIWPFAHSCGTG